MNAMSENSKLVLVKGNQSSAGTAINTDSVDMDGFEGVMFFGVIETVSGNSANASQSSDDSTFNDLENTAVAPGDDGDSFLIDIFRPTDRYVRCEVDRSGTNTAVGDIYAVLYGARSAPVTHGATIDNEIHVSPAEGTA